MTLWNPLTAAQDEPARVLHVDDDADFADLTAAFLERESDRLAVETATDAETGLRKLEDEAFDCVVSDYDMPGRNGVEFLAAVRELCPDLPFVLFTGKGSEEVASEAISAGVTDYLQKETGTDQYAVLANRVENAVEHVRSRTLAERGERRLREVIDFVPDLVYVVDRDGTYLAANEALASFHGTTVAAIEGARVEDVLPESVAERFRANLEAVLDGDASTRTRTLETADANGERHVFEARLVPYEPEGADEPAALGMAVDVTERELRERELERVRDLLARTESIADVGGWELDAETGEVFWTDHLFALLGVERETPPPFEDILDIFHGEDRATLEAAVEAAQEGEPYDLTLRFERDGELRWARVQGVPVREDGEVVTLRGAVRDVTERTERERELARSRSESQTLIDGMNDTAWVISLDGDFLAVNDAAVEHLGYSRDELLAMHPHDIDARLDEAEITGLIDRMPDAGQQVFETVHETADGEWVPVEISSSLITYRDRTAVLSIGRDISERKKREEQLEAFASIVSHDLRNPLNVASGHTELAAEECDSEHLATARRAHERMDALIDDLLTLAREGTQVGEREPVPLDALCRECWHNVSSGDAAMVADSGLTLHADRSRLKQLFENLFRNAVEHGSTNSRPLAGDPVEHGSTEDRNAQRSEDAVEHGSTSNRAKPDDPVEHASTGSQTQSDAVVVHVESGVTVTVGALPDGEGFYVEDDGPGIPAEERERVFEAGYTAAPEGTGLGLGIVAQVAEAHGWTVEATESEAGGARFEVWTA